MKAILWFLALVSLAWGVIRGLTGHVGEAGFWVAIAVALCGWAIAEGEIAARERKNDDDWRAL